MICLWGQPNVDLYFYICLQETPHVNDLHFYICLQETPHVNDLHFYICLQETPHVNDLHFYICLQETPHVNDLHFWYVYESSQVRVRMLLPYTLLYSVHHLWQATVTVEMNRVRSDPIPENRASNNQNIISCIFTYYYIFYILWNL